MGERVIIQRKPGSDSIVGGHFLATIDGTWWWIRDQERAHVFVDRGKAGAWISSSARDPANYNLITAADPAP